MKTKLVIDDVGEGKFKVISFMWQCPNCLCVDEFYKIPEKEAICKDCKEKIEFSNYDEVITQNEK
jgi:hypothetical protein